MIMFWLELPVILRKKMVSVKLKGDQTIHQLIDMIETFRKFKGITSPWTIELNTPPNYIIESYDKTLIKYIKEYCPTNTIHRNEDC